MQEQDLFALKSIKIPVQKHSFLTETFPNPSDPQEAMPQGSQTPAKPQNRARAQPHIQEATDFLMEIDNDTDKLIQTTIDQDEDFLDNSQKAEFAFKGQRLASHGADWGINWWNAVVAMLLIGIVLPLFYVIYFKTKKDSGSGALQESNISNASETNFSMRGPKVFQEPG